MHGMRADAKPNQVLLGLAKAIEATFSRGDWLELGLITDSEAIIRNHRRLLRGLEYGDDDYSGNILDVLPSVLGERSGHPRLGDGRQHIVYR
jgi:AbiJ N-terminal domain 5